MLSPWSCFQGQSMFICEKLLDCKIGRKRNIKSKTEGLGLGANEVPQVWFCSGCISHRRNGTIFDLACLRGAGGECKSHPIYLPSSM